MKKKVLWIAPYAFYDTVGHAGGKVENFYLKEMYKTGKFDITVIYCYDTHEKNKIDFDLYGIKSALIENSSTFPKSLIRKAMNIESKFNPFNRYAGLLQNSREFLLKKVIREYSQNKQSEPDVLILGWTETSLLMDYIKGIFPKAKVICIEEDVAFLGRKRKCELETNKIKCKLLKIRYEKLKRLELAALKKADLIVNTSSKDRDLLVQNGIKKDKTFVWISFFENYGDISYKRDGKDIIFFGAMSRRENYKSAIWFIENVFHKLPDKECRFIIIGGRPHKSLMKYQSERIIVTGFVEDVRPYFSSALCFVAPLLLGAGIKIKILEAFSAGLPVLTNEIGIEGIPATSGKEFYFCETPEEYIERIDMFLRDEREGERLSVNVKQFINEKYNLQHSLETFINFVESI